MGPQTAGKIFSNAKEPCIHNPDKDLEAVGSIPCLNLHSVFDDEALSLALTHLFFGVAIILCRHVQMNRQQITKYRIYQAP